MQLVCPAGNLPALQAAVDAGADAVYAGLRDQTNARAFPGLNFGDEELRQGIAYAHARGARVYLALNTYPDSARLAQWQAAVDKAAGLGCDAVIVAEMAVLDYAARAHPALPRHLSVQGSATTAPALRYMHERFGIARAVLPRVLSIQQVERLCESAPVPLEVFAFGSLCIMVEGRCQLSSYVTGASPNRHGVCSPAGFVRWEEHADGTPQRAPQPRADRPLRAGRAGRLSHRVQGPLRGGRRDLPRAGGAGQPQHAGAAAAAGAGRRGGAEDRGSPARRGLRRLGHAHLARGAGPLPRRARAVAAAARLAVRAGPPRRGPPDHARSLPPPLALNR